MKAGREGREKFGSKRGKEKGGGTNNQVKVKNKAFAMMKHSRAVREKARMSKRDKQVCVVLKYHLIVIATTCKTCEETKDGAVCLTSCIIFLHLNN